MTSPRPSAVILLSGGLDSTVTAAIAQQDGYRIYCMTVSYGQRHHVEVERARAVAERLGAAGHVVVTVDLRAIGGSALTADVKVPKDRTQEEP
jgi:7-cyano-7-deazaguanine synthase